MLICCFSTISLTAQVYILNHTKLKITAHTQFYTGVEIVKPKVFVATESTIKDSSDEHKKCIRSTRNKKTERSIARGQKKTEKQKEKAVVSKQSLYYKFHIMPGDTEAVMVSISKQYSLSIPAVYAYKNVYTKNQLRNIIDLFSGEKKITYVFYHFITDSYCQVHAQRGPPLSKYI